MIKDRIFLFAVLVIGTASVSSARDYIIPEGVKVLTEDQLLKTIVGSTFHNYRWDEYYEPPASNQKQGKLKMKHIKYVLNNGRWSVEGHLFCVSYEKLPLSAQGGCYTMALDGEKSTWYNTDGSIWYSYGGSPMLISGNPNNL